MPASARAWAEPRFGTSFENVRIHTDGHAARSADKVAARAFTVGNHITFGAGQFTPDTSAGKRLLAHELTHVVQRSGSPTVARQDASTSNTMHERTMSEIEAHRAIAADQMGQDGNLMLRANATRRHLLFTWRTLPPIHTDDDLDAYVIECTNVALTEIGTLNAFSSPGAELALMMYPQGFPLTWSGRVHAALTMGTDLAMIVKIWIDALMRLAEAAATLPTALYDHGLPLSADQLDRLTAEFRIRITDSTGPERSPVTAFVKEAIRHTQTRWISSFAFMWEYSVGQIAGAVADGTVVPSFHDWKDFTENKQTILRSLPERAQSLLARDDAQLEQLEKDGLHLADAALAAGMMSGLAALMSISAGWTEASTLFSTALESADAMVAAAGDGDRLWKALSWAWENGYFGSAAADVVRNLIANGPETLGKTGALLIAGNIPYLNILVATYLIYTTARDVIGLLDESVSSIVAVTTATSVRDLQKGSHRLATVLTEGAFQILMVLITAGAGKAVAKLHKRTTQLRASNATLTEEAAQKAALAELTAEERAFFEQGPAKQAAQFKSAERKMSESFPSSTTGNTPRSHPTGTGSTANVTKETAEVFQRRPELKRALDSSPRAADALRKCSSPCFPEFASTTQVDRLNRILAAADENGIQYNKQELRNYLRGTNTSAELETAIDRLNRDVNTKLRDARISAEVESEFLEAAGKPPIAAEEYRLRTAQLRAQPGVAHGGNRKTGTRFFAATKDGPDYRVAQIPSRIARQLSGRRFDSFDHLRQTFWRLVATDTSLASEFLYATGKVKVDNLARMRAGLAPVVPGRKVTQSKTPGRTKENDHEWTGGGSNRVYHLNHRQAIEHHGDIYDLDNLEIVTPRYHAEIEGK